MSATDRIEENPKVMMGKPVIRGTRIPVELVLRKLAEGATFEDLLAAYPRLRREDIQAALGYAADAVAHEETLILPAAGSSQSA
ncbi:MAG: antitoxin [Candidatus Rokubacteria bacterium GWC2_70_16]|nr:MAG: antitoxin [Candidatus Rokubacteria bacterium GWC2_70_16]